MQTKQIVYLILTATWLLSSCTPQPTAKKAAPESLPAEVAPTPDEVDSTIQQNIFTLGSSFRLLSSKQLKKKITTCVGENQDIVTTENIIGSGSSARYRFLSPGQVSTGSSIFDFYTEELDGPTFSTATATRVSKISVPYVSALQAIANLAAYHCSLELEKDGQQSNLSEDEESSAPSTTTASLCDCSTSKLALKMLQRCMSDIRIDEEHNQELVEAFSNQCQADPPAAISSMISSILFARSP